MFTVNFWGSHPAEANDDLWYAEDFETLEGAKAAFDAPVIDFPQCPARDVAYVELDGCVDRATNDNVIRKNPTFVQVRNSNADWDREHATQLGMGLGIDAYNDALES